MGRYLSMMNKNGEHNVVQDYTFLPFVISSDDTNNQEVTMTKLNSDLNVIVNNAVQEALAKILSQQPAKVQPTVTVTDGAEYPDWIPQSLRGMTHRGQAYPTKFMMEQPQNWVAAAFARAYPTDDREPRSDSVTRFIENTYGWNKAANDPKGCVVQYCMMLKLHAEGKQTTDTVRVKTAKNSVKPEKTEATSPLTGEPMVSNPDVNSSRKWVPRYTFRTVFDRQIMLDRLTNEVSIVNE